MFHSTYDELLEDNSIDAVYIALPPSEHARWTLRNSQDLWIDFLSDYAATF
jgi:predicted dehydrogenase